MSFEVEDIAPYMATLSHTISTYMRVMNQGDKTSYAQARAAIEVANAMISLTLFLNGKDYAEWLEDQLAENTGEGTKTVLEDLQQVTRKQPTEPSKQN